ncbi:MAG: choice-of-anchor Q domain-containing protein [Phycisphaerales bacterium]
MNAKKAILSTLLATLLWQSALAESIDWTLGATPVAGWTISPTNPGPSDVITFSGPTKVYSNSCVGENAMGGPPGLSIDPVSKTILLWFQGTTTGICPLIYMPVCGVEGDFGPLEPGEWTFVSANESLGLDMTFIVQSAAQVYRVDGDAPGPAHNGTSWSRAFLRLQDALAVAGNGDEIWVAEGSYKPDEGTGVTPGDRAASFLLTEGLTIRGGFAGYGHADPDARDFSLHETVLDGDLNDNDLWGILNVGDNSYHVITGPAGSPAAMLDGLTVTAGWANGDYPDHSGGGLYNPGGALDIANCLFQGNTGAWGGGVMNLAGVLRMVNTQLIGNRALMLGGGLQNYGGEVTMHNCRIVGNSADYADAVGGSAVYNLDGALTILDSTVADNLSPIGQAISGFSWGTSVGTQIRVANSILYNGGDEIWTNDLSTVQVTYSDVQGGWTGTGNISANPQFASPGARSIEGEWIDGDYRLTTASPAINAGNNGILPTDLFDLDGDTNTAEQLPLDLDGEARIQGTRVDMGAYEGAAASGGGFDGGLTVCIGSSCMTLLPDPNAPASSYSYIGNTSVTIQLNFKGQLSATATATSAAGGTWTAWVVPNIVGPGTVTVQVWVQVVGLDISVLPGGSTVQVAEVKLYVVPVP